MAAVEGRRAGRAEEVLSRARNALTVRQVFGEAYGRDGMVVIRVASVRGGSGGGPVADEAAGTGAGEGFGISARPVGMHRIRGDDVSWHPAIDVTRVIVGGQVVGIVALLAIRSIVKLIAGRQQPGRVSR